MAARFVRPALAVLLALGAAASPAGARTHHHTTTTQHKTGRTTSHASHSSKARDTHRRAKRHETSKKPVEHRGAAPAGVTGVPAGGLKIYCPHNSPLLIRKATQGAGTTVTVVCR